MKKFLLSLLVAAFTCGNVMAQSVDVSAVLGRYTSDIYLSIEEPITDETQPLSGIPVDLQAGTESNTVKLAIYDLQLSGIGSLGDIVLDNVQLVDAGSGKYTFAEQDAVSMDLLGGVIQASVGINTENSYIDGDQLYIDLDILWTNGGNTPIYVRVVSTEKGQGTDVSEVLGRYTSDIYLSIEEPITDETQPLSGIPVDLQAGTESNTVKLAIYDLQLSGIGSLGDIVLDNVQLVDGGSGKYTFAEQEAVSMDLLGGVIQASVGINTENSYIDGDQLYIDLDILWTNGGNTPIYVRVVSTEKTVAGISSVAADASRRVASGVYNLAGVRVADKVSSALPAGLYIVDGQKKLVK